MYVQTQEAGAFALQFLPWESSKHYIFRAFVALAIQHAMRMRHIFIGGVSDSTICFDVIPKRLRFLRKRLLNMKCVV